MSVLFTAVPSGLRTAPYMTQAPNGCLKNLTISPSFSEIRINRTKTAPLLPSKMSAFSVTHYTTSTALHRVGHRADRAVSVNDIGLWSTFLGMGHSLQSGLPRESDVVRQGRHTRETVTGQCQPGTQAADAPALSASPLTGTPRSPNFHVHNASSV